MNNSQKGAWILVVLVIALVMTFAGVQVAEKYRPEQSAYRYGFIDTNPVRRTGQFFDTCSPENMEDCSRNNPYAGLPLP